METHPIIDNLIYGRVAPHIYAFETNTVPNFLKVGDTYRPVSVRLKEWELRYADLVEKFRGPATVNDDTYFRDYAVHDYLIAHGKRRIEDDDYTDGTYHSSEFFKDASETDVESAIDDIRRSFKAREKRYTFYNIEDRIPLTEGDYPRDADWQPRDNQKEVIQRYKEAINHGRTHLLMYAVMRFGKSFTALCCAKETGARLVVVVCGKTDVREEWKKNVQKPKILEGYFFLHSGSLVECPNVISDYLSQGKKVVLFLTLQDLLGKDVKEKHQDLFRLNEQGAIDLLIVDESHFAARSEETGKVLRKMSQQDIARELKVYDTSLAEAEESIKVFNPKVTLHLSGTPYRILMNGEFRKEDIVAFVQYNDIIAERDEWDANNMDMEEWKNPYYGFPQMVRFAFNLNESSMARLEALKNEENDFALNILFQPRSTKEDGKKLYQHFIYEKEVIDLLSAIDGTKEDPNVFSFLAYPKIEEGQMCHHIVMVLPFRASCDAMQRLLNKHRFNKLSKYKILNISGFDCPPQYQATHPNHVENVVNDIRRFEEKGKRTITLTVGRMLTGSTVEYWDTMIYLRGGYSPEVYDQAIFRLQNQYVKKIKSAGGEEIVYNMKPQTLLVDFDPTRMFVMQNRKSLISNINKETRGNENLVERIGEDLHLSPIIYMNKGLLKEVTPTDIVDAVRRYSADKSILDEMLEIEVDDTVFDDDAARAIIMREAEMKKTGAVFKTKPSEGEGDDADIPDGEIPKERDRKNREDKETPEAREEEQTSLRKRLQTYYFKILLFAYLSDGQEQSLKDILECIETTEDGRRIARHLQLDVEGIKLIRKALHPMALNHLEDKINNIDTLSTDPEANLQTAMHRFSRLSESEIVTSEEVADDMISLLPKDVTSSSRFLNIAGKVGEFELALCKRYGDAVKYNIFTIPTSGVTYECTRKMFSLLGIPMSNLITHTTTFDLIDADESSEIIQRLRNMKFNVVVGNPPYQLIDKGDAASDAGAPIYHKLFRTAKILTPNYIDMIMPSKWMVGGRLELSSFLEEMKNDTHINVMKDFRNDRMIFPMTHNDGGICYFLWNAKKINPKLRYLFYTMEGQCVPNDTLKNRFFDFVVRDARFLNILNKVFPNGAEVSSFSKIISKTRPFGIRKDLFNSPSNYPNSGFSPTPRQGSIRIYGVKGKKGGARRTEGYFAKSLVTDKYNALDKYKIFFTTTYSSDAKEAPDFILADRMEACTETFLVIGPFSTKLERDNCAAYMRTNFFKFLLYCGHGTMQVNPKVFSLIPLVDFGQKWTDKKLQEFFKLTKNDMDFIKDILNT